jgi:hypothetical protein
MISVRFLSPLHLDFALHSQVIIFIIIALALDLVHPTTIQFIFHWTTFIVTTPRGMSPAASYPS